MDISSDVQMKTKHWFIEITNNARYVMRKLSYLFKIPGALGMSFKIKKKKQGQGNDILLCFSPRTYLGLQ